MKKEDKGLILFLAGGGLSMLAYPPLGIALLCIAGMFEWRILLRKQWPWMQRLRKNKYAPISGYVAISVLCAILVTGFIIHGYYRSRKPIGQPVTTTNVENSPGTKVYNIQGVNNLKINESDPNDIAAIKKGVDRANRMLDDLESQGVKLRQLEKEYEFGFVIVAWPDQVDATRARPYTSKISADWDNFRIYSDANGKLWVKVPEMHLKGLPGASQDIYESTWGVPDWPGKRERTHRCGDIRVFVERLHTSYGVCAVIGLKKIDPLSK